MHHDDEDAEERPERRRAGRRGAARRWVQLALALGVLGLLAVPGTHASWTDPVPVSGAGFTTGTVDLKVQGSDLVTTYTTMNSSTMEPGDSTAGVLTVTNAGTAPLRYYVDANVSSGLGSTLVAKVTSDASTSGSAPSVTCGGAALAVSSSTFGSNLVGSAASPRELAGGATETLCVQARLPAGSSALGESTTIGFTFNAFTGTAGSPGWADAVPVSGTSLGTINAFYLGTNASANTTSSTLLPLRRSGPALTTLYNYDTNRDGSAGLLLQRNASQAWNLPVTGTPLALNGTASIRVWGAVSGGGSATGALSVSLYDCDVNGASCGPALITSTSPVWTGGTGWASRTWSITSVPSAYTWQVGRSLQVRLTAAGGSNSDMLLAYDTTTYRSAVIIQ